MTVPARAALARAEEALADGRDDLGFLSERYGLLPARPPRPSLPESHRAWDDVAAGLAELFRSQTARDVLEDMPVLDADPDALGDDCLWRACSLLWMFAHTYVRVGPGPVTTLPASILQPWEVLCRRLHRTQTALSYDDLIGCNWRLKDPSHPRRILDNLELMTPTVGNREERVFDLVQVEMLAEGAPMVGAMVRAQEAARDHEEERLGHALVDLLESLGAVDRSFRQVDANPYSPTFVDPVVWAKTVAPFAVTLRAGNRSISGASAPLFQLLDVFVGRRRYESRVGRESRSLRPGFSPQLGAFVDALGQVSVADHIAEHGSAALRGLWHSLGEAYWGDQGFLAVHRRKAYAFLELAFKVGRSVTTGGFTGLFDDQTWEVAHRELEAARQERLDIAQGWCPMSDPGRAVVGGLTAPGITHLQLDVAGEGIRHDPGDRLAVLPENDPALVERTLRALRAGGDEPVRLDDRWRAALSARRHHPAGPFIRLRELLTLGRIRPVTRAAAKALLAASQSQGLARIVDARAEGDWELWDLLDLLSGSGFQPRRLWRADPWDPASIAKIVPPDDSRLYSISSARPSGELTSEVLELLVADVHYQTAAADVSPAAARSGTASGFLHRVATGAAGTRAMAVGVVPSPRFRPVGDDEPMVMFAGGSGMAPFRAFLAARGRDPAPAGLRGGDRRGLAVRAPRRRVPGVGQDALPGRGGRERGEARLRDPRRGHRRGRLGRRAHAVQGPAAAGGPPALPLGLRHQPSRCRPRRTPGPHHGYGRAPRGLPGPPSSARRRRAGAGRNGRRGVADRGVGLAELVPG